MSSMLQSGMLPSSSYIPMSSTIKQLLLHNTNSNLNPSENKLPVFFQIADNGGTVTGNSGNEVVFDHRNMNSNNYSSNNQNDPHLGQYGG
jgi:hypothetical protein